MNGVQTTQTGGFEKVVFESVIDTFAGGVCLDPTGLSAAFPDGVVPAGTLVSTKDATTGLSNVVTITPGTPDTYSKPPLGLTAASIQITSNNNPLVGVVIEGVVRKSAIAAAVATGSDDLIKVLPKLTFV